MISYFHFINQSGTAPFVFTPADPLKLPFISSYTATVTISSLSCVCYFKQEKRLFLMTQRENFYFIAQRYFPEGYHQFDWCDSMPQATLPKQIVLPTRHYLQILVSKDADSDVADGIADDEWLHVAVEYEIIEPEAPVAENPSKFLSMEPVNSWESKTLNSLPAYSSLSTYGNSATIKFGNFILNKAKFKLWISPLYTEPNIGIYLRKVSDPSQVIVVYSIWSALGLDSTGYAPVELAIPSQYIGSEVFLEIYYPSSTGGDPMIVLDRFEIID